MNKYCINIHYDTVISVEVMAESEDEALELAEEKAEMMSLEGADVVGIQKCVTFEEEIK